MIYKRYEFSLSQNGDKLVYIARNAAGIVVFRENSEDSLREAIDDAIFEQERQDELNLKKKLARENKKKKEKHAEITADEATSEEKISTHAEKSVTRGPDGKFISKNQLNQEEPKKKGFWDKLTS